MRFCFYKGVFLSVTPFLERLFIEQPLALKQETNYSIELNIPLEACVGETIQLEYSNLEGELYVNACLGFKKIHSSPLQSLSNPSQYVKEGTVFQTRVRTLVS